MDPTLALSGSVQPIPLDSYDGKQLMANGVPVLTLSNFLGGGSTGMVYQAHDPVTGERFALKVLNPVCYKVIPSTLLKRFTVVEEGRPLPPHLSVDEIEEEHLYWLYNPSSRQVIAAYMDERAQTLKEIPLNACVRLWTWEPYEATLLCDSLQDGAELDATEACQQTGRMVVHKGQKICIPRVPPKFLHFVQRRRSICREIATMCLIQQNPHVITLHAVYEHVQEARTTVFMKLDFIDGGEFFDRYTHTPAG